jgi:amino acid transporter
MNTPAHAAVPTGAPLKRSLSLAHATLYGLGVTIGAGIYVLIGAAASRSGMHAPLAFAAAAVLMGLSAASFAELAGRYPVAAGEAAYMREAFGSNVLATAIGLLVVSIAIVSAAAISVGSAGYLSVFVPLPRQALVAAIVLAMGAIAAWGVKESVSFAAAMTVIEIAGLLLLIGAGAATNGSALIERLPEAVPPFADTSALAGIMGTVLLAVFAFIGFEGLANVAEEVHEPQRILPRAIFLTLAIATVLYMLVVWVALVAVPITELSQSGAPLALVFERLTGATPRAMSAIAIVATLNGIIVQLIMASRVLYGLARQGGLPTFFARVHAGTRTPIPATLFATAAVLGLALAVPLEHLADLTSRMTLVVFAGVNASLIRVKALHPEAGPDLYWVPGWVPWAGLASCLALLLADLAVTMRT